MAKVKHSSIIDIVDHSISHGVNKEILHLSTNKVISGRKLIIKGKEVIHFGNCNYLGLERHPAVKQASIEAIQQEGIRLTMSRAYVSSGYYVELEKLLSQMYGGHVVVAPSSTMLHLSAIPVLFGRDDLCLLDQQVHASMTQAVQYAKSNGLKTKTVRHNRIDLLEQFIKRYRNEYEKIWYVLDGIYSMYGDAPDIEALVTLLDKYPNFYLYVDDAHGCSWKGENGKGFILDKVDLHEKMMMTVSLGKGFGVIGGVLVTKDPEYCRRVRTCGNTMIFSAPLSSGLLGAAIASAKIHLTDELTKLQNDLQDKIRYTNQLCKEYHLPLVRDEESPIFYIGVGLPKAAYKMLELLLDDGYLCNIGVFPAVSLKCAGIRFLATCHLHKKDIKGLIERIAYHLPRVLADENFSFKKLAKAFDLPHFEKLGQYYQLENQQVAPSVNGKKLSTDIGKLGDLKLNYYTSINDIEDKEEWNKAMSHLGIFDVRTLQTTEDIFSNNTKANENYNFLYYTIRDANNELLLAAFFTESLWKEDLLAPASVSKVFEEKREKEDPHYMISNSISLGCQAYEGKPLYIKTSHEQWKEAMEMLLETVWEEEEQRKTELIVFRDMDPTDEKLNHFFMDKGFMLADMPNLNLIEKIDWKDQESFAKNLSYNSRKHFKKNIAPYIDQFEIGKVERRKEKEMAVIYELYLNVQKVNLGINTFPLPPQFFDELLAHDDFDLIKLEIKSEYSHSGEKKIVGFVAAKIINGTYYGLYLGMDYDYLHSHKIYRQILWQFINRAQEVGAETVHLGFSADIEKQKFGSTLKPKVAFVQFKDNYKQTVINNMGVEHLKKHY